MTSLPDSERKDYWNAMRPQHFFQGWGLVFILSISIIINTILFIHS